MNFLKWLFVPTEKEIFEEMDVYSILLHLEERIEKLELENVELTNALYESENRLQAKIDSIHPVTYNLQNYSLDK
jgi:hypothetical protein